MCLKFHFLRSMFNVRVPGLSLKYWVLLPDLDLSSFSLDRLDPDKEREPRVHLHILNQIPVLELLTKHCTTLITWSPNTVPPVMTQCAGFMRWTASYWESLAPYTGTLYSCVDLMRSSAGPSCHFLTSHLWTNIIPLSGQTDATEVLHSRPWQFPHYTNREAAITPAPTPTCGSKWLFLFIKCSYKPLVTWSTWSHMETIHNQETARQRAAVLCLSTLAPPLSGAIWDGSHDQPGLNLPIYSPPCPDGQIWTLPPGLTF